MSSPVSKEQLLKKFEDLSISYELHEHPAIPTVKDGAKHWASIPGVHCKNLFLRDAKKRYWLVTTPIDREIRLNELPRLIGSARLSFAQPHRLMEHLGVEPGSVTPFALINDTDLNVNVILDDWMMRQPIVNFHPLVNTATVGLSPKDLMRFILSCGHNPYQVDLCPEDESLDDKIAESVGCGF